MSPRSARRRTANRGPHIAIAVGALTALVHVTLAVAGVMTAAQWISGVVIGVLVAGIGNHLRVFGRR